MNELNQLISWGSPVGIGIFVLLIGLSVFLVGHALKAMDTSAKHGSQSDREGDKP